MTAAIISHTLRPLKCALREGWIAVTRTPPVLAMVGATFALSLLALTSPPPLTEPELVTIDIFAGAVQFFVLASCIALAVGPFRWTGDSAFPIRSEVHALARVLGATAGLAAWLILVVGFQFVLSRIASGAKRPIDWRLFLELWARSVAFGIVLVAWTQFLLRAVRPSTALFGLLTLVLTAYLLPRAGARFPTVRHAFALIPDLGALSPFEAGGGSSWSARTHALYPFLHASAIGCLGGLAFPSRRRVDRFESAP